MKYTLFAVLLAPCAVACSTPNTIASYPVTQPVLLGPIDHIGPGPALKTHAVAQKLHTEFEHVISSSSTQSTEEWSTKAKGVTSAMAVLGDNLQRDIHITSLETSGKGSFCGVSMGANIEVDGDVVEVEAKP